MTEHIDMEMAVRGFLDQAFDGDEPPHGALAESAILRGDRARRRNRALGTAGGATLGVAALVGTMALGFGSGTESPTGKNAALHGVWQPGWADNVYGAVRNMPGTLNPLLPAGVTLKWQPVDEHLPLNSGPGSPTVGMGTSLLRGGHFALSGADGTDNVSFVKVSDPKSIRDVGQCLSAQGFVVSYRGTKSPTPVCQKVQVPGGTVVTVTAIDPKVGPDAKHPNECESAYQFLPSDNSYVFAMILGCAGQDHVQLSPQQFADIVKKPGFADVVTLADLTKPATSAGKQARIEIDAALATAMKPVLPAGYRFRLPNTAGFVWPTELVGPDGALIGEAEFDYGRTDPREAKGTKVPGGWLATDRDGQPDVGTTFGYHFIPDSDPSKRVNLQITTSGEQPLTTDQFLTMVRNPGIYQAIDAANAAIFW